MASGRTLTVQARKASDDFWMVWDEEGMVGSVRSMRELVDLLKTHDVAMSDVRWEPGARDDLEQAGGLPRLRTDS